MPQLRESFLRKTNLQHAMHNFYWYIIEFYFPSDPFSNEQSTKCSGKNIYAVGIEIVWSLCERYIGTFYIFFFSALQFSFSLQSGFVSFRRSRVGSRTENIFLNVLCERIYTEISVYWNSTQQTNCAAAGWKNNFYTSHRFLNICLCFTHKTSSYFKLQRM